MHVRAFLKCPFVTVHKNRCRTLLSPSGWSCPRFLMAGVSVICSRFLGCSGVIAPACVARILTALLMYGHKKKALPNS